MYTLQVTLSILWSVAWLVRPSVRPSVRPLVGPSARYAVEIFAKKYYSITSPTSSLVRHQGWNLRKRPVRPFHYTFIRPSLSSVSAPLSTVPNVYSNRNVILSLLYIYYFKTLSTF